MTRETRNQKQARILHTARVGENAGPPVSLIARRRYETPVNVPSAAVPNAVTSGAGFVMRSMTIGNITVEVVNNRGITTNSSRTVTSVYLYNFVTIVSIKRLFLICNDFANQKNRLYYQSISCLPQYKPRVAQPAEQLPLKQTVGGSSPPARTLQNIAVLCA